MSLYVVTIRQNRATRRLLVDAASKEAALAVGRWFVDTYTNLTDAPCECLGCEPATPTDRTVLPRMHQVMA